MFQGWRFQLREAEEAAEQGQFDEACRLLVQGELRQYLPGKRLTARVAELLALRGRRRVVQGDLAAGWRDLQNARALAGDTEAVLSAREDMVALALGEAEHHLEQGDTARAIELVENLERWEVRDEPVRRLKDAARRLASAHHLARHGNFAAAESQARTVARLFPRCDFALARAEEYRRQIEPFRRCVESLHQAVAGKCWTDATRLADEALAMAPESGLARTVQRRAWSEVQMRMSDTPGEAAPGPDHAVQDRVAVRDESPADGVALVQPAVGPRFLLWIDGVGGYLVCLAADVVVGRAGPDNHIDIPIQADLSRRHARIHRQGDSYVIEPLQATRVNGQVVRGRTLLSDGDEIELAETVRLRFRQPHALSASARLDFVSRHRTQPTADGILLMAESCVLGPKWQNHICCRDWKSDVVLYRRDGGLYCRALELLEIDGHVCDGRGQLGHNSHISGSDFSMSLEELS